MGLSKYYFPRNGSMTVKCLVGLGMKVDYHRRQPCQKYIKVEFLLCNCGFCRCEIKNTYFTWKMQ